MDALLLHFLGLGSKVYSHIYLNYDQTLKASLYTQETFSCVYIKVIPLTLKSNVAGGHNKKNGMT